MTDYPALRTFLTGYWHQTSSDLYAGIADAIDDFVETEGHSRGQRLCDDLILLLDQSLSAEAAEQTLADPRLDSFWRPFDRVLSEADCWVAITILRGSAN